MTITTIYSTCATTEEAAHIGRTLVTEQLAACANIIPSITSIYTWNNQTEEAEEAVLLAKTRPELVDTLTRRIRELHSYKCPCVVAWASSGGNPDYLQWILNSTRTTSEPPPPTGTANQ